MCIRDSLAYNVGTALSWALTFTALGLLFGTAATAAFRHYAHFQALFFGGSLLFAALIHVASRRVGERIEATS